MGQSIPSVPVTRLPAAPFDGVKRFHGLCRQQPAMCAPGEQAHCQQRLRGAHERY